MKKWITVSFLTIFGLLINSHPVRAQEILFQDDFSEGLNKWESTRNNIGLWSIVNNKANVEVNSGSTITEIVPKDEYWNYSWKNIEFEFDYTPISGVDKNFSFKIDDLNNSYEFHYAFGQVEASRIINGVVVFQNFFPHDLSNGSTHNIKIQLIDDKIKLIVNGELIADIIDSSYNSNGGKIGLKAGTGSVYPTKVLFDNVIVRSLDTQEPTTLQVPYFSQKDPIWADDEYDSVSQYSWATTPTMARYGCATTSMAMLLNFHGLTHLPDGALLTPQSLNNWLKTQPDGYIREGLISWNAVTRLTQKIADVHPGKPKLEYSYVAGMDTDRASAEINAQQPVIFQVPGHFVVGLGHLDDTFQIHDPFWIERTSLDNAEYQNTFDSMRLFTPSQTDLSYITVATDNGFTASLLDSDEQPIDFDSFEEGGLLDQETQNGGQSVTRITQLAKPESGEYILTLEGIVGQNYSVDVFLYDKNGEVDIFHFNGFQEKPLEKFLITFNKDGGSFVEKITSTSEYDFDDLILFLEIMYQHGDIKNYRTYWQFATLVLTAKYSPTNHVKDVLLGVIAKQFNNQKSKDVTDFAKEYFIPKVQAVQIKYQ